MAAGLRRHPNSTPPLTAAASMGSPQWRRRSPMASIAAAVLFILVLRPVASAIDPSKNYKISPKPCAAQGYEGTCMFVWECIKSEGQHIGMCVDSFMFGSCCAHNLTENVVLPQTISYVPNKPISVTKRPVYSSKPVVSSSGLTTIQRPNGSGMLVVRPNPVVTRPTRPPPAPSNLLDFNPVHNTIITEDLSAESSVSTGSWNNHNNFAHNTVQWQMTTQPNFITKPKPSSWDKPTPTRNKVKPTKTKPQIFQQKPFTSATNRPSVLSSSSSSPYSSPPSSPSSYYQSPPTKGYPTRTTTSVPVTQTTTTRPPPPQRTTTTTTTTQRPTTTVPIRPISSNNAANSPFSSDTRPSSSSSSSGGGGSSESTTDSLLSRGDLTISAARGLECGKPTMVQRPEQRIVGGKNANFGRWPWQVSVRRTSFFGFSSTHRCGGAVLNANWIATAGHCVDDLLTNQIRIRVGEYDFSHVSEQLPYVERAVSKKIVHPKYNFFTYEYDLALVKLETPLEFTDHIAPICLPGTDDLLIGANATVTGWGRLSEGGTLPTVLQEVSVPIVSNDRCKAMFLRAGRHEFIPEIFLCAGHETGGQDSCQGDSGGPLQVRADNGHYFLAGIISWGIGCAEANLPGVCTRISKFVPWILQNVNAE